MRNKLFPVLLCISTLTVQTASLRAALVDYTFTGRLQDFTPQFIPAAASAALKSCQANDRFYLTFTINTLAPNTGSSFVAFYDNAVQSIRFSVPSRGVLYTGTAGLRVMANASNPHEFRWDVNGVDSTVNMILWARDFTKTALSSSAMPDLLNFSGFHQPGGSFARISLFNSVQGTIASNDLIPVPTLQFTRGVGTNKISWTTSDTTFPSVLQKSTVLGPGAIWTDVMNPPVLNGLTNIVSVPADTNSSAFFRARVP